MDTIRVNDVEISNSAITAEMQHHPASTSDEAYHEAARALVVQELLLARARVLAIEPEIRRDQSGRLETVDDAMIRALLEVEVVVPKAEDTEVRRYYENNLARFRSPDLFEAAHILLSASFENGEKYAEASRLAEQLISILSERPMAFDDLAREYSDCSSSSEGGRIGQIARGETTPEFETFLLNLDEGQLCPVPVKTFYGVHVLRLDRRIPGRQLPFETVQERIEDYLHETVWQRAVAQYIRMLAGVAAIEGIAFDQASTPLVQ